MCQTVIIRKIFKIQMSSIGAELEEYFRKTARLEKTPKPTIYQLSVVVDGKEDRHEILQIPGEQVTDYRLGQLDQQLPVVAYVLPAGGGCLVEINPDVFMVTEATRRCASFSEDASSTNGGVPFRMVEIDMMPRVEAGETLHVGSSIAGFESSLTLSGVDRSSGLPCECVVFDGRTESAFCD